MAYRKQQGFVLAVTLWLLAAVAVVAALVSGWASDAVRESSDQQDAFEQERGMHDVAQTLVYLAVTRDLTRAGLPVQTIDREAYARRRLDELGGVDPTPIGGELRLDDRLYTLRDGISFSVQDEAGLLGLRVPDIEAANRIASVLPENAQQAPMLRDSLLDYIDPDSQQRALGTESQATDTSGAANRRLLSPREISWVPGWASLSVPVQRQASDLFSAFYMGPVNINTAPVSVLAMYMQGCPATCESVVSLRDETPIVSLDDAKDTLGLSERAIEDGQYRTVASEFLRITVRGMNGQGFRLHLRVEEVPNHRAPWTILSYYPVRTTAQNGGTRLDNALLATAAARDP